MYSTYDTVPLIHLVKNQISKYARRIAIYQTLVMGTIIILVGLLYSIKDELLNVPQSVLEDINALQDYLTNLIQEYSTIFSFMFFIAVILLIIGIMNLIAFFKLAKGFNMLARVIPPISRQANNSGNFIRFALFAQIASILLGSFISLGGSYITEIINILAFILLVVAYYNISQIFKILYQNQLYPKKESKLLFYSQIIPLISMIPLSYSIYQLGTGSEINIIPLIISGVIIILGYIGMMLGFYNLSKDVFLIEINTFVSITETQRREYSTQKEEEVYIQQPKPTSEKYSENQLEDELPVQFCSNCGTKLKPGKLYCRNCGIKIDEF